MSKEAMKLALEAAYLAGWNASGEGYNSEYPFGDHARNPEEDSAWIKDRDNALRKALAEQPAQQEPVAWGIIASNTGRICQVELDADEIEGHNPKYIVPLYTSPPPCPTCEALARTVMLDQTSHDAQRQWVGLTEEEHTQIAINCGCMSADWVFYGAAVERNLKEKNT